MKSRSPHPGTTTFTARVHDLLEVAEKKPILVVGSGITGKSLARLFLQAGFQVTVVDEREIQDAAPFDGAELRPYCMRDRGWFGGADQYAFAVTSPGISPESEVLTLLGGVPQLSEVDFATAFLGRPLVGVTGTNGKTTTSSLIHAMVTASGQEFSLVGNIGRPLVELLSPEQVAERARPRSEFAPMVAELSSYQLESSENLSPHIGVWLNLGENHLERHKTMERYLEAKARIFAGQDPRRDFAVLGADDPRCGEMKKRCGARQMLFGRWRGEPVGSGCFYDREGGAIYLFHDGEVEDYSVKRTALIGEHNKLNIAAAIPAARLAGATPEEVQRTINSFQPIEHRLEWVRDLRGVTYLNDTKATTVAAAAAALDAVCAEFPGRAVVVLLGGQAKVGSWEPVRERLQRGCRAAVCFGGDGERIAHELKGDGALGGCLLETVSTLRDAVVRATFLAQSSDIVLLSPGCASFDGYRNFEERGRDFKGVVCGLEE